MGKPPGRSANVQNAVDYAKRAKESADRGDHKHAVYLLMIAVNNLAGELDNIDEILVMAKIVAEPNR